MKNQPLRTLIACLFLGSLTARAQMHVMPLNPGFDARKVPGVIVDSPKEVSQLPPRSKRNEFFSRYPAAAEIIGPWDELEKDMLWMRLKQATLPELKKKYPSIPATTLGQMQKELK